MLKQIQGLLQYNELDELAALKSKEVYGPKAGILVLNQIRKNLEATLCYINREYKLEPEIVCQYINQNFLQYLSSRYITITGRKKLCKKDLQILCFPLWEKDENFPEKFIEYLNNLVSYLES
jgi:hypothetical protein